MEHGGLAIDITYPDENQTMGQAKAGWLYFFPNRHYSGKSAMKFAADCEPLRLPIKNSELGKYLSDGDCRALTIVMNVRDLADGEVLVNEGDMDNTLFFVTSGCIKVSTTVEWPEEDRQHHEAGRLRGHPLLRRAHARQVTCAPRSTMVV